MLEILKTTYKDNNALLVILVVIILAIGGSYRLVTAEIDKIWARVEGTEKTAQSASERLHELDKRITVLEIKNEH